MTRVAASIADVSTSPRRFHAALGGEGRRARALVQRPRIRAVASRFDGSLLGEEMIAALGDRLAATLRWWASPAVSGPEERPRVLTRLQQATANDVPRPTSVSPLGRHSSASRVPEVAGRGSSVRETSSQGVVRDTMPSGRQQHGSGQPESIAAREVAPALLQPSSTAAAPWIEYGAGAPPRLNRAATRLSPLVAALRKWESAPAPPQHGSPPAHAASSPVRLANARSPQQPAANAAAPAHDAAQALSSAEDRAADIPALTPALLSRERDRQWWTARVDAIHARVDGSTAIAAPTVTPAAVHADDMAFADTLGEVLRSQAKLYGVDVI
jgi:hypothetical protein